VYAREQKLLRDKDDNLTGDDVREGLTAIIHVKLRRAAVRGADQDQARQYRGQVVRPEGLQHHLRDWFERNPGGAKAIIIKATQAARARIAAPGSARPDPQETCWAPPRCRASC